MNLIYGEIPQGKERDIFTGKLTATLIITDISDVSVLTQNKVVSAPGLTLFQNLAIILFNHNQQK